MATKPRPHADLDNQYLATAMRANGEIRRLIDRMNEEPALSNGQLKGYLLRMVLAVAEQTEALHEMNRIRLEHSRRLRRNAHSSTA